MEQGFAPPLPNKIQLDVILEHLTWSCGQGNLRHVAARYDRLARDGIRRLVMTNTSEEEKDRESLGIDGAQIASTVYIPDQVVRPLDMETVFDAVYIARLAPFKRFQLASQIVSLKILTGGKGSFDKLCPRLQQADYAMDKLPAEKVAEWVNRSACGLALSETEGVMLGSFEYLLCGRPVVSTPSIGGRDQYYNEHNSILVDADAGSVALGVREVRRHSFDRLRIRRDAMVRHETDRYRLARKLSVIRRELGGSYISPETIYADMFLNPRGFSKRYVKTVTKMQPDSSQLLADYGPPAQLRLRPDVFIDQAHDRLFACCGEDLLVILDDTHNQVLGMCATGRSVDDLIAESGSSGPGEVGERIRNVAEELLTAGVIGFSN